MQAPLVDEDVLSRIKGWRGYVEAKLGFRNHWYPVRFSGEIEEGQPIALTLLGEKILINRIDGGLHAIRDRCLHRGVQLSAKLQCFTKDTITCWYHGYTYRFTDGELCHIVAVPNSKLIGRRHIRRYPVQEAKGVVFVFVGDANQAPPPLVQDVPPGFLDDDVVVRGLWRIVKSNWRIGAENGFDNIHVFIHRDSILVKYQDLHLPLGHTPAQAEEGGMLITDPAGPKGVIEPFANHKPVWEAVIDGKTVLKGAVDGTARFPTSTSIWLPCALKVDPFPDPALVQFEWYVPETPGTHIYLQTIAGKAGTAAEKLHFDREFQTRWKPYALYGFNDEDIWAREQTEAFYADDWGWIDEGLCEPDGTILRWRTLASDYNRGIQRLEHLR